MTITEETCWTCGGYGIAHCCEGERPGNVKERLHPICEVPDDRRKKVGIPQSVAKDFNRADMKATRRPAGKGRR